MKRHRARQGLSLAELLITTTIVGVIMMGMVSVDYALRTNEQQQTRAALVSLRTSATLTDMTVNARQAYGDVATRCIQIANIAADNTNYICIYRDIDAAGVPNNTPSVYADDRWVCYTRRGTNMHKCMRTVAAGPNACPAATPIGTVTTDVYAAPDTPVVTSNAATLDFNFQLTLKNRYDPTVAGATYAAILPQEYLTNPKVKMTTSVSPQGCTP